MRSKVDFHCLTVASISEAMMKCFSLTPSFSASFFLESECEMA